MTVNHITEPDTVNITAHNPYSNFSFVIELNYIDEDEEKRESIIWIVIIVIAVVMIISLLVVYCKQRHTAKGFKSALRDQNQESLITVEDRYKDEYINRTSADPESIRGTIDLGLTDSLLEKEKGNTEENLTPVA